MILWVKITLCSRNQKQIFAEYLGVLKFRCFSLQFTLMSDRYKTQLYMKQIDFFFLLLHSMADDLLHFDAQTVVLYHFRTRNNKGS